MMEKNETFSLNSESDSFESISEDDEDDVTEKNHANCEKGPYPVLRRRANILLASAPNVKQMIKKLEKVFGGRGSVIFYRDGNYYIKTTVVRHLFDEKMAK